VEADLSHKLGETRVVVQGVGHGVGVQVHQAVDFFLIREVEQAEGLIALAKSNANSPLLTREWNRSARQPAQSPGSQRYLLRFCGVSLICT